MAMEESTHSLIMASQALLLILVVLVVPATNGIRIQIPAARTAQLIELRLMVSTRNKRTVTQSQRKETIPTQMAMAAITQVTAHNMEHQFLHQRMELPSHVEKSSDSEKV